MLLAEVAVPIEIPIVIADLEHSIEPFNDREKLVNLVVCLAEKVLESLKTDEQSNKRYVRRMVLSNKSCLTGKREDYIIELPKLHDCWNDVSNLDIQLAIIQRIQDFSEDYTWYKVRIYLGDFFNENVRRLLLELEEKERQEAALRRRRRRREALRLKMAAQAVSENEAAKPQANVPQVGEQNAQKKVNPGNKQIINSQVEEPKSKESVKRPISEPAKDMIAASHLAKPQISNDDDDDIEVIFIKKKPSLP